MEHNLGYWLTRNILRICFKLCIKIEVEGLDYLKCPGPCLIVLNHLSLIDLPLLSIFFPRRGWAVVADNYRNHLLFGPILRLIGVIFVKRGEVDRRAIRKILEVLKNGGAVGIHPEGTRSKTGQMQKAKDGIAYLAYHSRATIIPVGITGTEKVIDSIKTFKRPLVRLIVGQPFRHPDYDSSKKCSQYSDYTDLIMKRLANLLPESYRGFYQVDSPSISTGDSSEMLI